MSETPGGSAAGGRVVGGRIVGSDGRAKAYRPLDKVARRAAREAGIAAYEERHFWHAHELLEPAWMGSPDPAERDLDQGLIKLAAAYVHAERGNAAGMRKNLLGARRRLAAVVREHGAAGRRAAANAAVDVSLLLARIEDALARVDDVLAPVEEGLSRAEEALAPGDEAIVRSDRPLAQREGRHGKVRGGLLALAPPPEIPRTGP